MNDLPKSSRPAHVCGALLLALAAAEGLRRKRKRDQTPDGIGLAVKRQLLSRVVADDPDPEAFEAWLLRYVDDNDAAGFPGALLAMARTALDEWRLAQASADFAAWLDGGAPSADTIGTGAADPAAGRR